MNKSVSRTLSSDTNTKIEPAYFYKINISCTVVGAIPPNRCRGMSISKITEKTIPLSELSAHKLNEYSIVK